MELIKTETEWLDEYHSCAKVTKTYKHPISGTVQKKEEFHGLCLNPACANLDTHCGCAHE